jgi:hypothetical protein
MVKSNRFGEPRPARPSFRWPPSFCVLKIVPAEDAMRIFLGALFLAFTTLGSATLACESALHNLVGYTLLAASEVEKDQLHEVSEDKRTTITLKNEMTFRFARVPKDHWGFGGFTQSVFVFAKTPTEKEVEWLKKYNLPLPKADRYQLLIGGSVFEVERVR